MDSPLTYLSLFSGIGGLDLGLDRAGWTCVGQVEKDDFCQRVLAKHWPEVPKYDDVRTAPQWWLGATRPAVDLVAGGFPCQGHSVAGRRRGTADERWGWPWYRSVVEAVRPRWILVENVPNLVRTGLVDVLRDLADLGFDAWWAGVPAAAVGAPHLRWRLFVIAADSERVDLRDQPGWERGPDREGPPVVGHDGAAWALADTESHGRRQGRPWRSAGAGPDRQGLSAQELAHADGKGLEGRGVPWPTAECRGDVSHPDCDQHQGRAHARRGQRAAFLPAADPDGVGRFGWAGQGRQQDRWGQSPYGDWWAAEPDVGRVAHGVPARMDRLKGLGNAVVPQVAEHIGRMILALHLVTP